MTPADWGGDTEFVDVSAKARTNLDELLETLTTLSDIQELKANPNTEASGVVIESRLDPGRGPVVSVLISRGTLKVGDAIVAGEHPGRARAMHDYLGERIKAATPARRSRYSVSTAFPRLASSSASSATSARRGGSPASARKRLQDRGAGSPRRRQGLARGRPRAGPEGRAQGAGPDRQGRRGGFARGARGRDREAAAGGGHRQPDPHRRRWDRRVRRDAGVGIKR